MTDPVVFRHNFAVALLTMLRYTMPAVVGVGMLFVITRIYGVEFDSNFVLLAVLIAILAPAILQQPPVSTMQIVGQQWPTAAGLLLRWLVLLFVLLAIGYITKISEEFSRRALLTWALATPVVLVSLVAALNEAMRRIMFSPENARTAVIAGCNDVSLALAERLRGSPEMCISVDGFFDDRSAARLGLGEQQEILGGLGDLPGYVKSHGIEVIFMSLPMRHVQRVLDLLEDLRDTTASIYYLPDIFVFDLIQSRTGEIVGMPVVAMCETPFYGYRGVIKRLMDLGIASVALVALTPLLLTVAALVKLTSPGPVIFKQRRYGLDGLEIQVYKFRTMTVTEDGGRIRQATRDDERVTPLGRVLRRLSIDELPQLINVIEGTMSLVGPRPHAVAHNEMYRKLIKGYMIRHKVLPGMTGLAQVSGCRGETSALKDMEARIRYDLDYLRYWSPMLDLKILLRTALVLIHDRKAY